MYRYFQYSYVLVCHGYQAFQYEISIRVYAICLYYIFCHPDIVTVTDAYAGTAVIIGYLPGPCTGIVAPTTCLAGACQQYGYACQQCCFEIWDMYALPAK